VTLRRSEVWALLGTLAALVLLNLPIVGAQPWNFRPGSVDPTGVLGPLVKAADGEWDLGLLRSIATLTGLLVALAAAAALRTSAWRPRVAVALTLTVVAALILPAVALQAGLRQATAPWFHTNDSTYQIELAGDLVLDGRNPYGHDYGRSGLERFYSRDGSVAPGTREDQVALRHLAYFPGTPLTGAAWRLLPAPLDDYRFFVALATLALVGAALLFPGPLGWKLALGAVAAANPLLVRAAWFGTADAPALLGVMLAFGLLMRRRVLLAATALAAAVLVKQFALVALPFFAVALLLRTPRPLALRAGAAFAGVLAAGALPFLVAGPADLWRDTISYGTDTYRIVGYGLSATLLNLGVLEDRRGPYPFLPILLVTWLPVTAWLVWSQVRSRALWVGAAGFSISIFLLIFLGRVFQTSYLAWPLTGLVLTVLLAASERRA